LEQDYNSLHAQREACEAFIRSQAGEGWRLMKAAYDDGGYSGGTMERPALQRLLANIRESMIDVIVVYKVDRLTRSLADFARIVELLDARGVSFVAVTQQFNTTTSMGRLTLNVLLSFAQFEREVIGERIRDKVAASKRKGMWMGGLAPLGYDVRDRHLLVNPDEAQKVKYIFERYLELGTVRELKKDLATHGFVSASRVSKSGNTRGGTAFSRGALYHLLSNPIYVGEIPHKKDRHPGQHEALINREVWDRVQMLLRRKTRRQHQSCQADAQRSPLTGKLFDENGEPLYVQGAAKGKRRYRYYVSKDLVRGDSDTPEKGWRIAAPEIEQAVTAAAVAMLADESAVTLAVESLGTNSDRVSCVLHSSQTWLERLQSASESVSALVVLVTRVDISPEGMRLLLELPLPPTTGANGECRERISLSTMFPVEMKRRGIEMRMVLEGDCEPSRFDRPLIKAIARARRWSKQLLSREIPSIREIARQERIAPRYVRDLLPLGFLSPRIVEAILQGHQPADITVIALTRRIDLPLLWSVQERVLGLRDSARLVPSESADESSDGTTRISV
jgi:DNA invertase Pin-like site-specific DNA recombinase